MRVRALLPWLAAGVLAAGCVTPTTLRPPATAPTTRTGQPLAEGEGVRLVASGDAWRGNPRYLENVVTPVEVRLENQSGRPLRIAYEDFTLVGGSRFEYAALTLFELREEGESAVGGSGLDGREPRVRAWVGSPLRWGMSGRGWNAWGPGWYGPGWYDPFFGGGWYARPAPQPLPTEDMVRRALPRGTLPPGGTLTGFLYFQNVGEREGQVTLQARLVDARTGETFGTLSIPFDVRS